MIYYQGDDINFSIDIKQVIDGETQSWSAYKSVIVYLYTHSFNIAKFKNAKEAGYTELVLSSDNTKYHAKLAPDQTRTMVGALMMSIRLIDQNGDVSTKDSYTGIKIVPTPIKHEQ